jgi:prephenate dehydrogenase
LLSDGNRGLAATGFRDTTRIAAGDPDLWSPILLSNADAVVRGLDTYSEILTRFREAVAAGDVTLLKKLLGDAKSRRTALG